MNEVQIIGGHHDGLTGQVHPDVIRLGFLVQSSTDRDGAELWHAYHSTGERDDQGRYVFRPGSGGGAA